MLSPIPSALPKRSGRPRPLARRSLILLVFLCTSALALPGLNVTLPLLALFISLGINYWFAYRHVAGAELSLAAPPLGRVGHAMVWTVTTPEDPAARGGWLLVGASRRNRVPLVASRPTSLPVVLDQRGVFTVAQLHLISTGPMFLPLHATKQVLRNLSSPLVVAPRLSPIEPVLAAVTTARVAGDGEVSRGGDIPGGPESVRPFERGDRISSVHWPATARTGTVHVKQLEKLGGSQTITVIVDHIDGSARGEAILAEATWLVHSLVGGGFRVDLATTCARVQVSSTTQADEVLAAVEPGEFHGATGLMGQPNNGTVRAIGGQWCVNGVVVCPAGSTPIPDHSGSNPPIGIVRTHATQGILSPGLAEVPL